MQKCIVCMNNSFKTKDTHPRVIYHLFPKNVFMRRKWLQAIGIDHCDDKQRICSNHFLEKNYIPNIKKRILYRSTIPQAYNQKCVENSLPYSYTTTQSNNMQVDNNKYIKIRQNLLREEHIKNVANYFESPRRSCRQVKLTTTDENMSYKNMPNIQNELFKRQVSSVTKTDLTPVLTSTKEKTLGKRTRCSIKKCFNSYSKDLSLFGLPSDITLRKQWIEKCGLDVNPTDKIKQSVRVCGVHFDKNCFKNPEKRNRLIFGAVPSLFLDNDTIEARNIPSTSSSVKSKFVHVNKPSCSSSNYVANVNSREIPLLVYIDSTTRITKDFEPYCCISGCITNNDEDDDEITFFAPPKECINKWSSSLGLQLTVNSILCERHFRPKDILYPKLLVNGKKKIVKSLVPDCLPVPMNDPSSTKYKNNVLGNTDDTSKPIKDLLLNNSNISEKFKRIIAHNSLSVTLEPVNSKKIKTSVDSFSKTPAKNSLSITLQPIPKQNFSSTTNNSTPSVSLTHSLPSTSSSSVDRQSNTHDSNSDSNTNTSQYITILNDNKTKSVKKKDSGFIFEISKRVELPSLFWKCVHHSSRNNTTFYELDNSETIVKEINFYNSLMPIIKIYDLEYNLNGPITTLNQLKIILKTVDNFKKSSGMNEKMPTPSDVSPTLKSYVLINNMKPRL